MHEPSVNIPDIARVLSLKEEGGILGRSGVVELANSVAEDGTTRLPKGLGMGVFVVIRTDHPFIQEDLAGYFLHPGADGRNYLLYRPYHLVAVEAPISIAKAALFGMPTGSALRTPVAEVITVAKRALKAGELLDGGGGTTVNGLIEKAEVAREESLLPLGLAPGAKLLRPKKQGEAIAYGDVTMAPDSFVWKLRQMQDAV
jgi:predicted homoserine dehydrogenase-like protein